MPNDQITMPMSLENEWLELKDINVSENFGNQILGHVFWANKFNAISS